MNIKINKPFSSEEENKKYKNLFNNYVMKDINQMLMSNDPEVLKFLETFCASLILELNKKFPEPNYSIYMTYRIKSPKSKIDKLEDYLKRVELSDNVASIKEFTDLIGMRIIVEKIPHNISISKKDPNYEELAKLKEERLNNISLSEKYHDFSAKITDGDCTKFEYYNTSIKLIQSILNMLHDDSSTEYATDLRKTYKNLIGICNKNIQVLELMGDYSSFINNKNSKVDFFKLLDDFDSRIDSKLALKLYSNAIPTIFNNSETLNSLGATISSDSERTKLKREKSGFVADFKGINFKDIPLNFELQLMTIDEHLSSILGYSAHSNMPNKNPIRCELPNAYKNRMLSLLHNTEIEKINYDNLNLIHKILKIKNLSIEEKESINKIIQSISTKDLATDLSIDKISSKIIEKLYNLNETEEKELSNLLYKEGILKFNSWAENISAFHATVRLDKESSAKDRVKIDYDTPYERLSHLLRQQVEGYNLDDTDSNIVEQYLSYIYKNQDEWLESSGKSSSSIMAFEINDYINTELPHLKEKINYKDEDELEI